MLDDARGCPDHTSTTNAKKEPPYHKGHYFRDTPPEVVPAVDGSQVVAKWRSC